MSTFLSFVGIGLAYVLIRYRERVGDMVGSPDWANKVGGIYNLLILIGIFIFFWSLATLTGTTDILFAPLISIFVKKQTAF
jgi:uncharacterized membrane protein